MISRFIIKAWLSSEIMLYTHFSGKHIKYLYQKTLDYFEGTIQEAMTKAENIVITGRRECKALKIIQLAGYDLVIGATVDSDATIHWVYPDENNTIIEHQIEAQQQAAIEAIRKDDFETYRALHYQMELLGFQQASYYQYLSEDVPHKDIKRAASF